MGTLCGKGLMESLSTKIAVREVRGWIGSSSEDRRAGKMVAPRGQAEGSRDGRFPALAQPVWPPGKRWTLNKSQQGFTLEGQRTRGPENPWSEPPN